MQKSKSKINVSRSMLIEIAGAYEKENITPQIDKKWNEIIRLSEEIFESLFGPNYGVLITNIEASFHHKLIVPFTSKICINRFHSSATERSFIIQWHRNSHPGPDGCKKILDADLGSTHLEKVQISEIGKRVRRLWGFAGHYEIQKKGNRINVLREEIEYLEVHKSKMATLLVVERRLNLNNTYSKFEKRYPHLIKYLNLMLDTKGIIIVNRKSSKSYTSFE